jgi:hypothetical protein
VTLHFARCLFESRCAFFQTLEIPLPRVEMPMVGSYEDECANRTQDGLKGDSQRCQAVHRSCESYGRDRDCDHTNWYTDKQQGQRGLQENTTMPSRSYPRGLFRN